jgi:murein DD-endopeptidase MepM/ murein hydrolase activator NlpD
MKRLILIAMMVVWSSSIGSAYAGNVPLLNDPSGLSLGWPTENTTAADVTHHFGFAYPKMGRRTYPPVWVEAGIDITVSSATPAVHAAAAGTVVEVVAFMPGSTIPGYILIEHPGLNGLKFTTLYRSVTNISVLPGDSVSALQIIADVAGASLNFAIRDNPYDASHSAYTDVLPLYPYLGLPRFPEFFVDPLAYLP